ncbi:hypothetical protein [Inhella proteolytica]|uniref:Lipoprotein n=1 Tax=Inhella proteolytica TaxID=2795029 RepID=A0A931NHS9_9BURK|nr:hypothetical protein [Inhella proteolytica]MBH9578103.1 hypothetical protein [Inhella proteolytica]
MTRILSLATAATACVLLSACSGLVREARMQLPPELSASGAETLGPVGAGRRGEFKLDGAPLRYERESSTWQLFDRALEFGSAPLRFEWQRASGPRRASCTARRHELQAGVLAVELRPFQLRCEWDGGEAGEGGRAQLSLSERRVRATLDQREGEYQQGQLRLQISSVHQYEGSTLPSQRPLGYVMRVEGRVVGALDLVGGTPRLWRPDRASAPAVTEAATALALLWEPGSER